MSYQLLGTLIRSARTAVGLDQLELARRLDVGQQAVSGWERGISRPRRSQIERLANVLELSADDLRLAGDYDKSPSTPTQSLLPYLPFENLSDEAFEAFCRDLYARVYPTRTASRNGSTGQKQYGVDVFVEGDGERIGVQCKRHKTFGRESVRLAIGEVRAEAKVTSGVIALSRPTASAQVRLEIQEHPDWILRDGEDLSGMVRALPQAEALALVDTYFPGLREAFLGVRDPSPWLTPLEYDAALAGRLGFNRDFSLVGRDKELAALVRLTGDHRSRVILVGRGGLGKSRLLRELAGVDLGRVVTFAARGPLSPQSFEALPEGAPIVIIDDAMDAEFDLRSMELGIRRARPDATLLVSTRPTTLPAIREALEIPASVAEAITVALDDLELDQAEALAHEALGEASTKGRVETLASAGYDCPFIIVLGAHLIREGQLSDNDLASKATLRDEILTRFTDIVVRGSNASVRLSILETAASIQPARLDESDFLEALAGVSGQPQDVVLDVLDELEDLGLVLRRHQTIRVVPDLLGDAVLERALISSSGITKQFAQRLAEQAKGQALTHSLRNVSIIDWHRRALGPSELAGVLWSALNDHIEAQPNSGRIEFVKRVASVAGIYPDRAMELVDRLLDRPAPDELDPWSGIFGSPRNITHSDLTRELAPLVAAAGHNLDQLPRAIEILLQIGSADDRRENSNPDHAMRLLRELGEFHPRRPLRFNESYVSLIGDALASASDGAQRAKILSLLHASLAGEVMVTESKGFTLSFTRQSIDLEAVEAIRADAIRIATDALSLDVSTALAAVEVLHQGLQSAPAADEVSDEFASVTETLREVMADTSNDARVRLAAYRALGWHATYGDGASRMLARDARASLSVDDELILSRLMHSGSFLDDDDEEGDEASDGESDAVARYHRSVRRGEESMTDLVDRWLARYSETEILDRLRAAMQRELDDFGNFLSPDGLLQTFFARRPSLSMLALTSRTPNAAVDDAIASNALAIAIANEEPGVLTIARSIASEGEAAARAVASAALRGRSSPSATKVSILRDLTASQFGSVHAALLSAARFLDDVDPNLVMDMLVAAPIESDTDVADAAAGVLVGGKALPWTTLSAADRQEFLNRLAVTPRLAPYHLGQLLQLQIDIDPWPALQLLHRRIDTERTSEEWHPLPHVDSMPMDFRTSESLPDIIATHIDWMLAERDTWQRGLYGIQLLESMLGEYRNDALTVVLDLIRSRDESRIKLANDILDHGPHDLVLRSFEFVADAVELAQQLPKSLARHVYAGLHGSARFGMHSRSVGVDDPEEVELRDGAKAIAARLPVGSALRSFYEDVSEYAASRIADERSDDASLRDPRRWN